MSLEIGLTEGPINTQYAQLAALRALYRAQNRLTPRDGSLFCEGWERYLQLLHADGGKEIGGAKVFGVDADPLDGTGVAVAASGLDIEILHQGHAREEVLRRVQAERFGNAADGLEARIDALQRIGRLGRVFRDRQ